MTKIKNQEVFYQMEKLAPSSLAYDWDNVGLQIGSYDDTTTGVLVTLDVTEAVVDEAISQGLNVIIAHHPLIFKPLSSIDVHTNKGKLIRKIIQHNLTVYASHTNLDIAPGGVNDLLAQALELEDLRPLLATKEKSLIKLAVFTPKSHEAVVREAICQAGAGHIGAYSHCTFQTEGVGRFKPLEGANPYIGEISQVEAVEEVKIESILVEDRLAQVLKALKQAHPYEEVAYDLFPLKNKGEVLGIGRIGKLAEPMLLKDLILLVKKSYEVEKVRFIGDPRREVRKVAVLGGSGEKYIDQAMAAGADVFISGDISFHPAQEADEKSFAIIDPGHHVEKIMIKGVADYLQASLPNLRIQKSKCNRDPFRFM